MHGARAQRCSLAHEESPRGRPLPRAVAVVRAPHVHIQARVTVGTHRRRELALTPIVPALISPLDRAGRPASGATARATTRRSRPYPATASIQRLRRWV